MTVAIKDNLDKGLYTPERAAFYARVPLRRFNRWCFGDKQGGSVIDPLLAGQRIVTFLDFIQTLAIRHLRLYQEVSLPKIREGILRAVDEYGVEYPLARQHTMYLFDDELFIRLRGEQYDNLTGKNRNQMMMKEVCDLFARDVGWDPSGLAVSFNPYTWKDRNIRMEPQYHLGEPVVDRCHYTAYALWEAAKAEGNFENAAAAYGVDVDDVRAGYNYIDSLLVANAA